MASSTTDENDLQELLQKITDPASDTIDELAVNLFCSIIRANSVLIKKSCELIVSKIKSSNITQSRKAIELLEECMSKCGPEFQIAVARFQFLNELIRLVSKKFMGEETSPEIKNKILDCLSLWTVQYPERTKIKEAYETLLRSGVQHDVAPPVTPNEKRVDFIDYENEKLLRKLLQSKNREDIQRANLLIKYLVKQDAKKIELVAQQRLELQKTRNSAAILSQIIDRWVEDATIDEELAKEMYLICKKSKQIVIRMTEIIEDNEKLLGDAIEINEMLHVVIKKYDELVSVVKANQIQQSNKSPEVLTDVICSVENVQIVPNPLSDALDELSDIFSQSFDNKTFTQSNLDLLEPTPLNSAPSTNRVLKNSVKIDDNSTNDQELSTIDKLSEELFKENLCGERIRVFKREPNKVPIKYLLKNVLQGENNYTAQNSVSLQKLNSLNDGKADASSNKSTCLLDNMIQSACSSTLSEMSLLENLTENDNAHKQSIQVNPPETYGFDTLISMNMSNRTTENSQNLLLVENTSSADCVVRKTDDTEAKIENVIHLSEIDIELNSIRPGNERPRIVMDDMLGLRVTLSFALDRPTVNATVIVISTINQGSLPVNNYQLDASVKKPCKVRLLPPTGGSLPGVRPFRLPSEAIQQILILSNPTKGPVDLTCIIGYQQGEDPDPIKELIVVKDIPYSE